MPTLNKIDAMDLHKDLQRHARRLQEPGRHLRQLLKQPKRLSDFSCTGAELYFDFSRQRLDKDTLALLVDAAGQLNLRQRFGQMCSGDKINTTENRAVLHTASRRFDEKPIMLDGHDIMTDIKRVRHEIKTFSNEIHNQALTGGTGMPFRHIVVVGIGGSYLGTEFVACALAAYATSNIKLHYLTNVDSHNFGEILSAIDPSSTLWVVVSKSYTTAETMANVDLIEHHLTIEGLDPAHHVATVTAKGSPGDDASKSLLRSFHMFDYIGGRYSVTSAVGGVPLSLYLGYDHFEAFLQGAAEMDEHARTAPESQNIPLLAAMISVWNTTYLGYQQQAIIPYASPLAKLAPHIQQLSMESNGKSVDIDGQWLSEPAGTIIFGEPGTNAQHSFFQLAHQGRPFPVDFIGVRFPQYPQYPIQSNGVSNHQELWANMIAQAQALAVGQDNTSDKARSFTGNRPSSTLILKDLEPRNVGRLLGFYEARTAYESFIWGINGFDQFGVQLGKTVASNLRLQMAERNKNAHHLFEGVDAISKHYLDLLFKD